MADPSDHGHGKNAYDIGILKTIYISFLNKDNIV